MWVAVGKVSLDDCDMLTSSLGCTLTGGVAVAAMLAITSLVFILELVPEPVWKTSMGNWSSCRPSAISAAAAMIASALSGASRPRSLFTCAQAPFSSPSARIWVRSRPRPEIGKFSTARWVWARHNAFAGTRTSPMVSCSMRYAVSSRLSAIKFGSSTSGFVRFEAEWLLRQGIGGGAVTGEVDRGIFIELREPVVGLDHPDGARLRTHHDRLGGAATGVVAHPLE